MKHHAPFRAAEDWRHGGFALYVHWPYCSAKCPYCDFNSHVATRIDHKAWRTAYLRELEREAPRFAGRRLQSIFFGGGTPSLMEPYTVAEVIRGATDIWEPAIDLEVTLEANPTSSEAARFAGFREAGVNRLSIGVQALDDTALKRLGRQHDSATALAAVALARSLFDRVSLDLIYARQDQTLAQWEAELQHVLALHPDHLSLYQLTIEPETVFGRRHAEGRLTGLPDEDLAADMYDLTGDVCSAAGLAAYEISNYSRVGAAARHNLVYWRYGDFVGIGPGAHGRVMLEGHRYATIAERDPLRWLGSAHAGRSEHVSLNQLNALEQAEEMLMMGLRLYEGVSLSRYKELSGNPLSQTTIDRLRDDGLLESSDGSLRCTHDGRRLLNEILRHLLA